MLTMYSATGKNLPARKPQTLRDCELKLLHVVASARTSSVSCVKTSMIAQLEVQLESCETAHSCIALQRTRVAGDHVHLQNLTGKNITIGRFIFCVRNGTCRKQHANTILRSTGNSRMSVDGLTGLARDTKLEVLHFPIA
jgi:hypothetical protein